MQEERRKTSPHTKRRQEKINRTRYTLAPDSFISIMSWFKRKHKNDMFKYDDEEEYNQKQIGGVGGIVIDDAHSHSHSLPTDLPGVTTKQLRTVFWLNLVAFAFQAASAAGIILLIDNEKKYAFYTNYPIVSEEGGIPIGPNAKVAFSLNIGWFTGVFLALSALDHLLVCTIFKRSYEKGLSGHYNIFRWIEYALSASLMRVVVGVLSGVNDLHTIFLQFGLTATTMLFGLVFELENRELRLSGNVRWYIYWLGFIPHFFSWAVVLGYFFYSLSVGGNPPLFVYFIIGVIFVLDLSFAVVLGLQWQGKKCFRPYVNGEIAFIILSFTSKNLLAWINFFGGNR